MLISSSLAGVRLSSPEAPAGADVLSSLRNLEASLPEEFLPLMGALAWAERVHAVETIEGDRKSVV